MTFVRKLDEVNANLIVVFRMIINMRLTRLLNSFSIINKLTNKQRLINGSKYPRAPSESIPHINQQPSSVSLSPYQQYLIDNKALERPFTGKLWHQMSAGFYHCIVCNTRLFTYNHKFQPNTGYASFWRAIDQTVVTLDEEVKFDEVNVPRARNQPDNSVYQRCQCANCQSHLGAVFMDGPPPTFLRYSINSAMLKFYEFPDFPNPHIERDRRRSVNRRNNRVRYIR